MKCQEETEQDPEVREPAQAKEWVEAKVLEQEEEWEEVGVAGDRVAVPRQARAVIVSAPIVVREQSTNWGPPVTSSNALNAERLWPGNRR